MVRGLVFAATFGAALFGAASCTNDYAGFQASPGAASGSGATSGNAGSGVATGAVTTGAGASGPASAGAGAASSASTAGVGAAGGAGGAGGGPDVGGGSNSGGGQLGGGGASGFCGDGTIDPGEECDSGGMITLGCNGCLVECSGFGEVHDQVSHHCYYRATIGPTLDWSAAGDWCANNWGGHLVIFDTLAEFQFLAQSVPADYYWLGGSDLAQEGSFEWIDGSPVAFADGAPPWKPDEPNGNGDCLVWDVFTAGMADHDCSNAFEPFCERPPAGN